ncbi:hypothetical protein [Pasteuria penetrans]|uniref:hypothetical protein n=1 Tax=Pasteuria penetrans TaxID=86005 RepID=UPI000F99E782|nr:hypothetical protein [Pasteuria penetrans]
MFGAVTVAVSIVCTNTTEFETITFFQWTTTASPGHCTPGWEIKARCTEQSQGVFKKGSCSEDTSEQGWNGGSPHSTHPKYSIPMGYLCVVSWGNAGWDRWVDTYCESLVRFL